MSQYAPDLSSDDVMKLELKYDLKNNDTFCYSDFLRHFVLTQPRREKTESLLTRREKAAPASVTVREIDMVLFSVAYFSDVWLFLLRARSGMFALILFQLEGDSGRSQSAQTRVRQCVLMHWKDMKREFRAADVSSSGSCHVDDFR